jgi:hypothetical protein
LILIKEIKVGRFLYFRIFKLILFYFLLGSFYFVLFTLVLSLQPGLNEALFSGIAMEKFCKECLILLAIPEKKRVEDGKSCPKK